MILKGSTFCVVTHPYSCVNNCKYMYIYIYTYMYIHVMCVCACNEICVRIYKTCLFRQMTITSRNPLKKQKDGSSKASSSIPPQLKVSTDSAVVSEHNTELVKLYPSGNQKNSSHRCFLDDVPFPHIHGMLGSLQSVDRKHYISISRCTNI